MELSEAIRFTDAFKACGIRSYIFRQGEVYNLLIWTDVFSHSMSDKEEADNLLEGARSVQGDDKPCTETACDKWGKPDRCPHLDFIITETPWYELRTVLICKEGEHENK